MDSCINNIENFIQRPLSTQEAEWVTELHRQIQRAFPTGNTCATTKAVFKAVWRACTKSQQPLPIQSLLVVLDDLAKQDRCFHCDMSYFCKTTSHGYLQSEESRTDMPVINNLLLVGRLQVVNVRDIRGHRTLALTQDTRSIACEIQSSDPSLWHDDALVVCWKWTYLPTAPNSELLVDGYLELASPITKVVVPQVSRHIRSSVAFGPTTEHDSDTKIGFYGIATAISPLVRCKQYSVTLVEFNCRNDTKTVAFFNDAAIAMRSLVKIGQEYTLSGLMSVRLSLGNSTLDALKYNSKSTISYRPPNFVDLTDTSNFNNDKHRSRNKKKRKRHENSTEPQKKASKTEVNKTESAEAGDKAKESLITFTGVITAIEKDCKIILDEFVKVYFNHYPISNYGCGLRIGARIKLHHVHVVARNHKFQGLGLCMRSHIEVIQFSTNSIKLVSYSDFIDLEELHNTLRNKFRGLIDEMLISGSPIHHPVDSLVGKLVDISLRGTQSNKYSLKGFVEHTSGGCTVNSQDGTYDIAKRVVPLATLLELPEIVMLHESLATSPQIQGTLGSNKLAHVDLVGMLRLDPLEQHRRQGDPVFGSLYFCDSTASIPIVVQKPTTHMIGRIFKLSRFAIVSETLRNDVKVVYIQCKSTDMVLLDYIPAGHVEVRREEAEIAERMSRKLAGFSYSNSVTNNTATRDNSNLRKSLVFQPLAVWLENDLHIDGLCFGCTGQPKHPHQCVVIVLKTQTSLFQVLTPGELYFIFGAGYTSSSTLSFDACKGFTERVSVDILPSSIREQFEDSRKRAQSSLSITSLVAPTSVTYMHCSLADKLCDKTTAYTNERMDGKMKLTFKIRGYSAPDELDVFLDVQVPAAQTLGCLPGATLKLYGLEIRRSKHSTYAYLNYRSVVVVDEVSTVQGVSSEFNSAYICPDFRLLNISTKRLIELYLDNTMNKSVFAIAVHIREVSFLNLEYRCSACNTTITRRCPRRCAAPARLHAEMACIVEDGTAQAKVAWADTTAVLNLLKLEPADIQTLLENMRGGIRVVHSKVYSTTSEQSIDLYSQEDVLLSHIEQLKSRQADCYLVYAKRFAPKNEKDIVFLDAIQTYRLGGHRIQSECQRLIESLKSSNTAMPT